MKIFAKGLFFVLPFTILFLVLALAFFQHPAADDFVCNYIVKRLGIGDAYRYYLFSSHGTGRFFSLLLFTGIGASRFLLDHYYIVLLIFILSSYAVYFIFIRYFSRILFEDRFSSRRIHWLTAFLLIVTLSVIPEVSTFYYWTTAATYMFSFCLFLLYIIFLHGLICVPKKNIWNSKLIVAVVLAAMLSGSNEMTMYFSAALVAYLLLYRYIVLRRLQLSLLLLLGVHFFLSVFIFFSKGVQSKGYQFTLKQSVLFSAGNSIYQSGRIFYHLFSNPLFWVCFLGAVMAYPYLKTSIRQAAERKKTSLFFELSVLLLLVLFIHFFIRQWTGWVVPLRAENVIACIVALTLFFIAGCNGFMLTPLLKEKIKAWMPAKTFLMLSFTCLLFFNSFTANLLRSLIAAPVHLAVLENRVNEIRQAKFNGRQSIRFETYTSASRLVLYNAMSPKMANFIWEEFDFPPPYIFLKYKASMYEMDEAYAEYYGIDSIAIEKRIILRSNLHTLFK